MYNLHLSGALHFTACCCHIYFDNYNLNHLNCLLWVMVVILSAEARVLEYIPYIVEWRVRSLLGADKYAYVCDTNPNK